MSRIKNVVIISVPDVDNGEAVKRIGELRAKYQSRGKYGDKVIDFQKVLPMPDGLMNTPSGEDADKSYYIYTKINNFPCDEKVVAECEPKLREEFKRFNFHGEQAYERFLESLTRDPQNTLDISVGRELYLNRVNFGYRNWEDFHENVWGTRLNALQSKEIGCDTLVFETEGLSARPILDKIAAENTDVNLLCAFVDLNNLQDASVCEYKAGQMVNFNVTKGIEAGQYIKEHWDGNAFDMDSCFFARLERMKKDIDKSFVSHSMDFQVLRNVLPATPLITPETDKKVAVEKEKESSASLGRKLSGFFGNILAKENQYGDEGR